MASANNEKADIEKRGRILLPRLPYFGILVVIAFGILLGLLLVPGVWDGHSRLGSRDLGKPARHSITAPHDFEFQISSQELEGFKQEAAAAVQPVFDYFPEHATEVLGKIHAAFAGARHEEATAQSAEERRRRFGEALGVEISEAVGRSLEREDYSDDLRAALVYLVGSTFEEPIIEHRSDLANFTRGVLVRRTGVVGDDPREELLTDYRTIVGLAEARQQLTRKAEVNYAKLPRDQRAALVTLGTSLLAPNLKHHPKETERRRQIARDAATRGPTPFVRGQVILREGDLVRPEHLAIVDAMRHAAAPGNRFLTGLGIGLFVALLLGVLARYALDQMRSLEFTRRDLLVLCSLMLMLVGGCRGFALILARFGSEVTGLAPMAALAFPVAAGPMLVRLVLGARITLLFSVIVSCLGALALGGDAALAAYFLAVGIAGAIGVRRIQSRRAILQAGLLTGGVAAVAALSLAIYRGEATDWLRAVALAALSGVLSALLTTAFLPVLEAVFGYTTDITLLETANLSHPLLQELSLRAPGTYHHSMVVGTLAEAACEAIGCNGLLARVAAYFHDVGKGKNAAYFAENFQQGDNPHGRLKPSMSALIIRSHVKDSVDLLTEHRLPRLVIETATQHHGTTLIEYFHHKAQLDEDPDEDVHEEDYRYIGRKPQTREAGVLMLADSVEATARSLTEPSEDRLAQAVHRIINRKFSDGQLEECDLTLRDLTRIARAFRRVLRGIYHGRPAYPWQQTAVGAAPAPQKSSRDKEPKEQKDESGRVSLSTLEPDVTVEHSAEGRGLTRLRLD